MSGGEGVLVPEEVLNFLPGHERDLSPELNPKPQTLNPGTSKLETP